MELRPVEVGLRDFVNAEILSGLEMGEVVSLGETQSTDATAPEEMPDAPSGLLRDPERLLGGR
jgi:hypothetical protein